MADQNKRLASNAVGNFFVDATCINCDTCRQLAPLNFEEIGDYSAVSHQPVDEQQTHQAYQALLACPVGAIGTDQNAPSVLASAMDSFPLPIEENVYYCGFNSEKSFGANSFFVQHANGNWLIDSPRYINRLVADFEQRGGITYIFLTHQDDVADADKYAAHFGAKRIIHAGDADAVPAAEWVVEGGAHTQLASGFSAIPVPGHTAGSMALLYNEKFLFTGDHLWWNSQSRALQAPTQRIWRAKVLTASIRKLLDHRFEWVLAGHGDRVKLSHEAMRTELEALLNRRHDVPPSVR